MKKHCWVIEVYANGQWWSLNRKCFDVREAARFEMKRIKEQDKYFLVKTKYRIKKYVRES